MTATANPHNGWAPELPGGIPGGSSVPLQAAAQAGQGQTLFFNAAGDAALNDGTVPGLVCAGVAYPAKMSVAGVAAGDASINLWTGFGSGAPCSTISGDNFTKAHTCTPAFAATEGTLGRKSNYSGSNRSLAGLVLGVNDDDTPRAWVGPVAQCVARGVLIADNFALASFSVADAAASTAIAERPMRRPKVKGTVTDVTYTGTVIAADNTDYVLITIAKRSLADAYAAATTIATFDTRITGQGGFTALTPTSLTLSGTAANLQLLETDIVTIVTTKGASGKVLTGEFLVNGKAL